MNFHLKVRTLNFSRADVPHSHAAAMKPKTQSKFTIDVKPQTMKNSHQNLASIPLSA
jgi:hypothetical protein